MANLACIASKSGSLCRTSLRKSSLEISPRRSASDFWWYPELSADVHRPAMIVEEAREATIVRLNGDMCRPSSAAMMCLQAHKCMDGGDGGWQIPVSKVSRLDSSNRAALPLEPPPDKPSRGDGAPDTERDGAPDAERDGAPEARREGAAEAEAEVGRLDGMADAGRTNEPRLEALVKATPRVGVATPELAIPIELARLSRRAGEVVAEGARLVLLDGPRFNARSAAARRFIPDCGVPGPGVPATLGNGVSSTFPSKSGSVTERGGLQKARACGAPAAHRAHGGVVWRTCLEQVPPPHLPVPSPTAFSPAPKRSL